MDLSTAHELNVSGLAVGVDTVIPEPNTQNAELFGQRLGVGARCLSTSPQRWRGQVTLAGDLVWEGEEHASREEAWRSATAKLAESAVGFLREQLNDD